jgi:mRNA interferase RelE/StbE
LTERPWQVAFAGRARRDLRRLDHQVRDRILAAIDRLAGENPSGDIRRLTNRPESRMRVGDWRILFIRDDETRTLRILRVLPRGQAYDR